MDKETITKELAKKLDPAHVKQRKGFGSGNLSYIEGWFAISEFNRIFGHLTWSRETVLLEQIGDVRAYQNENGRDMFKVAYRAMVRVTVGDIVRVGSGFGNSQGGDPQDIHELAIKEAETDAMKRAMATFGYPLGLALYDKAMSHVGVDIEADETQLEELKALIVSASQDKQAWFINKYGSVDKVPPAMVCELINRLRATNGGSNATAH